MGCPQYVALLAAFSVALVGCMEIPGSPEFFEPSAIMAAAQGPRIGEPVKTVSWGYRYIIPYINLLIFDSSILVRPPPALLLFFFQSVRFGSRYGVTGSKADVRFAGGPVSLHLKLLGERSGQGTSLPLSRILQTKRIPGHMGFRLLIRKSLEREGS